jgi:hypothetical protein
MDGERRQPQLQFCHVEEKGYTFEVQRKGQCIAVDDEAGCGGGSWIQRVRAPSFRIPVERSETDGLARAKVTKKNNSEKDKTRGGRLKGRGGALLNERRKTTDDHSRDKDSGMGGCLKIDFC